MSEADNIRAVMPIYDTFSTEDEPISAAASVVASFSFSDGKIYRIREYYDTAAIVEAFR